VRGGTAWALGGVTLLAVALRLPFLAAGIGQDEGGYAYVAREWARGGHLYGSLWVDRPQGLMLSYRFLLDIADSAWVIRLGAVLAGAAVTVLVGVVGTLLRSRATGIAAAAIYAVVGVGPHIEGFTFNGELAAAVPATAAVACTVWWMRARDRRLLVAAGCLGATGLLMKQSGFDGLLVAAAVAAFGPADAIRQRLARMGLVAAGAAVPLAAAAVHGLTLGWSNYWNALVGWRAGGELNTYAQDRLTLLHDSLVNAAQKDLLVLACVALVGLGLCLWRRGALWVAAAWLLAALIGFNIGGLYWAHYYVELVAPLALLAAIAATELFRSRVVTVAVVLGALAPVAVTLTKWGLMSPARRVVAVPFVHTYRRDRQIASFIRARTTRRDTIYALSSQGDIYFMADRRSAERYLWAHPLHEIKGGLDDLLGVLTGPHPPRYVGVFRPPEKVDPSGRLGTILASDYRMVWRVPPKGVRVLEPRRRPQ
jgi:4-amino-4-deoxy-L-arabinose transferase-like glycosyltransferase